MSWQATVMDRPPADDLRQPAEEPLARTREQQACAPGQGPEAEQRRRPHVEHGGLDGRHVALAVVKVSVVIPTCGRPQLLLRCLNALVEQSLSPDDYEIVVVDDGHHDETETLVARVAEQTQGRPVIRYLRPEGTRGPAAARNRGWRAARAELIAFTDDDTIPDRDWLRYGLFAMQTGERPAIWGRTVVPTPPVPTDHEKNTRGLEAARFITANCFVRKAALEAVGGFDERYRKAWREDADLYFALMERYGEIDQVSAAVVVHPVREAPWGVSLKQQSNVYYDALLYKKYPRLYRERIRPVPPLRYYAIVGSTFLGLGCAVFGAWAWAGAAWAASMVLIGSFAWQRLRDTSREPRHVAEMIVTSAAIPFLSIYWRVRGAFHFRTPFV